MVGILVTGASGYIGSSVSRLLSHRGHSVFGLIRKESDAAALLQHEITPVFGDVTDFKWWTPELSSRISVVIDTVVLMDKADPAAPSKALAELLSKSANPSGRKHYIYTSGGLVYAGFPSTVQVDETFPRLGKLLPWRAQLEDDLLAPESEATAWRKNIDATVLRPSWVYGGQGTPYITSFFKPGNADGAIEILGSPTKVWSWCHVEDVASAFAAIVEAPRSKVAGEAFNVADHTRATYGDIRIAFARAAGAKPDAPIVNIPAATDRFGEALEASWVFTSDKLAQLGWKAAHHDVLQDLDKQYKAFKAYQENKK